VGVEISVITVVYNGAKYLQGTIDSIRGQDYKNVEYIVIDGGSSDGTLEIIEANARFISYWSSEPDTGIYDAMNKGIKAASGEYVLFINAGDSLYEADTLSRAMLLAPEADIIVGKTMLVDAHGNTLGERRLKPPLKLNWRSFSKGMLVSHQAFIARKSVTALFDLSYRVSSDIDWCIRVMKASTHIENIGTFIARYLVGGLSRQQTLLAWKERFFIMVKHYGLIKALTSHVLIIFRFTFYFAKTRNLD